jgi:hypothetical protein
MRTAFIVGLFSVASMVLYGLTATLYFQFYADRSWFELMFGITGDRRFWVNLLGFSQLALCAIPLYVALWRPAWAGNIIVFRTYEFGILLITVLLAVTTWVSRTHLTVVEAVVFGIYGVMFLFLSLLVLQGHPVFEIVYEAASEAFRKPSRRTSSTEKWRAWLQIHVPDPEEQEELKQALHDMRPSSRVSIIKGAILLTAGSWLVLNTLASVLEWLVQGWLNSSLPWF